ncbi:MAG: ABC transporter ATP-binding protein [Thermomicrobiales bacterium]|nr:ABC transporter ATP-binding protein [Thermomicrobiales bacterium]
MAGIVKRFPGVVANDGIDLSVRRGEIHALLGENGAGKSTLMNILMGLYPPDSGEIRIDGVPARFHSPRDAVNAGLGMVHQHFMLISRFTVTENVILGNEGASFTLDRRAAERTVGETAERYGLRVDPKALIDELPVGMQQRVEILRVLYQQSRTLILDEPTALLTPQEVEDLYDILLQLKEAGHTVIFITHKLREVAAISDRVTVIRRGKTVGTRETRETTAEELAELMVGRDVRLHVDRPPSQPGDAVLQVFDLHLRGKGNRDVLDGLSLGVRRGEIVGVAGVEGNGQTELVECIAGLQKPDSGTIMIQGTETTGWNPIELREVGLSYIPEDRHHRGLVLPFSLTENMLLGNSTFAPFSSGGRIDYARTREIAAKEMAEFDVRAPGPETPAGSLSGGNQQKFIIARELFREPDVILAIQPTRGLDVGAIEFVHGQLVEERDKGRGVMLISFDLDEIFDLADRILIIYQGRIVGDFPSGKITRAECGLLMGGKTIEQEGEPIRV